MLPRWSEENTHMVIGSESIKIGMEVHMLDGTRHATFDGGGRWKVVEAKVDGVWLKVVPDDRALRMREWASGWLKDQSERR
jgi:hypothetical protein